MGRPEIEEAVRPAAAGSPPPLRWTRHPLRQEPPAKSLLLVALIVGLTIGAAFSFEGLAHGVLTLCVLCGSLTRYFLPTRYCLDEGGVHSVHLGWQRQRPWSEFHRVEPLPNGIFLSPFIRPSRLDAFRGCFLRCGSNRAAVLRFAEAHVAAGPV
jgi:hypothetical protein